VLLNFMDPVTRSTTRQYGAANTIRGGTVHVNTHTETRSVELGNQDPKPLPPMCSTRSWLLRKPGAVMRMDQPAEALNAPLNGPTSLIYRRRRFRPYWIHADW